MLHLLKIEENGTRPYMLVRSRPAKGGHEQPTLQLIGTFDRAEVVELGEVIVDVLGAE